MRLSTLGALLPVVLACASARAAEAPVPKPKGAAAVGTVCGRQGTYVVVALAKGATVKAGEQLVVGRPRLLVSVATPKKRLSLWGDWHEAGRIIVRAALGARYCIAHVAKETPRPGLGRQAPPNIRPGDIVYRPTAPAPPKAKKAAP